MSDQAFLQQFEAAAIPAARWMHRDHVRIAYLYLRDRSFDDALARLRTGIQALNVANGGVNSDTAGYHETITVAWARLVAAALARVGRCEDFESFVAENVELLDKERLRSHYTKDLLTGSAARGAFVDPDLAPLP